MGGIWIFSAYKLRLFGKSNGCNNLREFSKELQMPCTIVGEDAISCLLQHATVLQQMNDSYLQIRMQDAADISAYTKWTNKLKGQLPNQDDDIIVVTPISKYVPKDRFIPDGMSSFSRQVKRIGDCILAFVALVLFSPALPALLHCGQTRGRWTCHLQAGADRPVRAPVQYLQIPFDAA